MKKLLLSGIAALFLATGTAHATEDFCAVVLKTHDGWLALREGPGTRFKMITKLHEGDFLLADTALGDQIKHEWVHINGVPRIDGHDEPEKTYTRGWVRGKYIQDFLCPEDQADQGKRSETEPRNPQPKPGDIKPEDLDGLPIYDTSKQEDLPTLDAHRDDWCRRNNWDGQSASCQDKKQWPKWLLER